jgi:hypothetical protein
LASAASVIETVPAPGGDALLAGRKEENMTRALALLGMSTLGLLASTVAVALPGESHRARPSVRVIERLSLELVGQFQNSAPGVTPPTHVHYGYLSYIRGLSAFRAPRQDEKSALFTFYSNAATPRVIANGPLRVVTRVGRVTIYRDASTNGDFARPASFRDGTPVLVAQLRQQVVLDTVTGSLTTFHRNRIVSTRPFPAGGRRVRLGRVGQKFRTILSGHVTMPGPPSGYIAGYAVNG